MSKVHVISDSESVENSEGRFRSLSEDERERSEVEDSGFGFGSVGSEQNGQSETNGGNDGGNQVEYQMYKRRWIGMGAIIALNLSTGLVWLTFTAVPGMAKEWLNTTETNVNLTAVLYFVAFVLVAPVSGFIFEKWGIKTALIVGGLLNIIGSWIRYIGAFIESDEENFEWRLSIVLIGQLIAAAGQPFFLNAPPKFAAVWFSEGSRATATTIGSISSPLSAALAFILFPSIVSTSSDIPRSLYVVGGIGIVAIIPAFIMQATPSTPPSPSAASAIADLVELPFWISIKKVSKNKAFWLLFIVFSLFVAFFNAVTSLIQQIVQPYKYSEDEAGLFGAGLIVAGLIGAGVAGPYVDKTKNYQNFIKCVTPLIALTYIAIIFTVRENFFWILIVSFAVMGLTSFSLLPVALELGIECTYPAPPSTSTSLLWMGGQAAAVIVLSLLDILRDDNLNADPPKNYKNALIFMAAFASVLSIVPFFYKAKNLRLEAERETRNAKTEI